MTEEKRKGGKWVSGLIGWSLFMTPTITTSTAFPIHRLYLGPAQSWSVHFTAKGKESRLTASCSILAKYKSPNTKTILQNVTLNVNVNALYPESPQFPHLPVFVYRAELPHPIWRRRQRTVQPVSVASTYVCLCLLPPRKTVGQTRRVLNRQLSTGLLGLCNICLNWHF